MSRSTTRRHLVRWTLAVLAAALPGAARSQAPAAPSEPPELLTLRRAVELALARAPQVDAARAAHAEGAASAELARDQFHPYALFTSSPGYTYGMPSTVVGRVPAVVGLEIRTAIYDPTRKSAALQAQATESALGASLESTCRGAAEAVVAAYARVWQDGM